MIKTWYGVIWTKLRALQERPLRRDAVVEVLDRVTPTGPEVAYLSRAFRKNVVSWRK